MTYILIFSLGVLSGLYVPGVIDLSSKSVPAHEYYVSVTEINYNYNANSLEVSTRIFADDLERALLRRGADSLHLGTQLEKQGADSLVAEYLGEKLTIRVDGILLEGKYLGKELSDDLSALWCYLEIEDVPDFQVLKVRNEVLMEVFDDQANMIELRRSGQREAYFILHSDKPTATHRF